VLIARVALSAVFFQQWHDFVNEINSQSRIRESSDCQNSDGLRAKIHAGLRYAKIAVCLSVKHAKCCEQSGD
jgi:hypothetical protein